MNNMTLHFKMLNDKVKLMNQTNGKNLTLSAAEARNLLSDIFDVLNYCYELNATKKSEEANAVVNIAMDGGGF